MSSSKVWMCLGLIVLVGTASMASAGESKNASAGESWLAAVTRESGEAKGRELADAPAAEKVHEFVALLSPPVPLVDCVDA